MFERVVRLEVPSERVESGIEWIKSTAIPAPARRMGSRAATGFFDRASGKAAVVTLWDSTETLAGSAQMAADLRKESAREWGTAPVSVEDYELVAEA